MEVANRGATKHCCYGTCNSDSRYAHKDYMKDVFFLKFPKANKDLNKCTKWVNACGRQNFGVNNVTKDTYICSLHFVGKAGPSDMHPDPIPATMTPIGIEKLTRKRKPPTPRNAPNERTTKRKKLMLDHSCPPSTSSHEVDDSSVITNEVATPRQQSTVEAQTQTPKIGTARHVDANLDLKIQNTLLRNENNLLKSEIELLQHAATTDVTHDPPPDKTRQSYFVDIDDTMKSDDQMKFYTGLTTAQFMCLWSFLGPAAKKLVYWNTDRDVPDRSPQKRPGPKRKLSARNELFLTVIRLRQGLLHQDLAYRFGVSTAMVSRIILTWVQFMYIQFGNVRETMFKSRNFIRQHFPKSFKKYKNLRCIIDCTEVFVQQPRNFGKQGNCYSSYKGHTTYKFLVAIAPNGAIMYVSDVFEGSISDREVVKQSGFLDKLNHGDVVMADRGFNIQDLLQERGASLVIPPFLGGRDKFTPQEEAATKDVAKHRIHVERSIERMKKFRLLQKIIPLSIQPVFSQMVFVIACLVNFQEPIVK